MWNKVYNSAFCRFSVVRALIGFSQLLFSPPGMKQSKTVSSSLSSSARRAADDAQRAVQKLFFSHWMRCVVRTKLSSFACFVTILFPACHRRHVKLNNTLILESEDDLGWDSKCHEGCDEQASLSNNVSLCALTFLKLKYSQFFSSNWMECMKPQETRHNNFYLIARALLERTSVWFKVWNSLFNVERKKLLNWKRSRDEL